MSQIAYAEESYPEIREEVRKLCTRFPSEYWRKLDEVRGTQRSLLML